MIWKNLWKKNMFFWGIIDNCQYVSIFVLYCVYYYNKIIYRSDKEIKKKSCLMIIIDFHIALPNDYLIYRIKLYYKMEFSYNFYIYDEFFTFILFIFIQILIISFWNRHYIIDFIDV